MKETTGKRRRVKSPAVLSRIVILLFLAMLLLFLNVNSITRFFNRTSYESVTAAVVRPTTDDFLLLIPKVELSYRYRGTAYTEKKFFVWEPLFGLSSEPGAEVPLYVNRQAPGHSIFKVSFFRNPVNWILLLLQAACIYNLVIRIRRYRSEKRKKKEAQRT